MMKCGLLGAKLGHSYSPKIHSYLGDYSFDLYEKKPEELADFLRFGDFRGLNVTMPYKKDVIPYCAELSPTARRLGAVNIIVRRDDGTLIGHNSDYCGFLSMVRVSGLSCAGKKVLVLGSGGASNTAVAALNELGANVIVISRTGENHYGNLQAHSDASVIVNTTPVGMYPNTLVSPVDLSLFPDLEGVLDVVYNPARTQLLLDAEKRGITAMNGLWMLVAQAKESSEWFTGSKIDDSMVAAIHRTLKREMENIVLIGMPGCGKSTVGAELSRKLNRPFVDVDEKIEEKAGMSIPQIFAAQGEAGFRALETQVLRELGKQSGLIIATGGGCVTREENYPLLHQNGCIVWLQRALDDLPTNGRPLSVSGRMAEMYRIREPMYRTFADFSADNNGELCDTVNQILDNLEETQ